MQNKFVEQGLTHTFISANLNDLHDHVAFTEGFLKSLISP